MQSILQQIRGNSVALISLMTAIIALSYNTWRNETTESQRNIRQASFRVLQSLGELQEVVDYRYYYLPFEESPHNEGDLRLRGYGGVLMIQDLMMLMPAPAPEAGENLYNLWNQNVDLLAELDSGDQHSSAASSAEKELGAAIKQARQAVLSVLEMLD